MKPLLIVHKPKKTDGPGPHGDALEAKLREDLPDGFDLVVIPFGCEVVVIETPRARSCAELSDGLGEEVAVKEQAVSEVSDYHQQQLNEYRKSMTGVVKALREQIVTLAKEKGELLAERNRAVEENWNVAVEVNIARNEEREACAKIIEEMSSGDGVSDVAAAIRNRGK